MEKSCLSRQILEYYYKFGQNRDLEKYLRLRRNCQKSSSEGSVNTTTEFHSNNFKNIGTSKFLDNLTLDQKQNRDPEESENELKDNEKQNKVRITLSEDIAQGLVQSKHTKSTGNLSTIGAVKVGINQLPTSEMDNQPVIETDDSNIEDLKLDQSNCSSNDNEILKSPSTAAKMEKLLEWDSLGDVGYNKFTNRKKQKSKITYLEKSILKEFLANQGIEINFPLNEDVEHSGDTNEKWRHVLDSAKKKFKNELERKIKLDSNQSSFVRKIPDTHSTAREETAEKYCQTSVTYPPAENKEVQVDILKRSSSNISSAEAESVVTPSSFEYIAPEIRYSEHSDKENHIAESSSSSPKNPKKINRSTRSVENHYHRSSSTDDASGSTFGVNLGVKLLCSLFEAKNLNNKQKKLLAKKIIAKITKKKLTSSNKNTTPTSNASLINTSQHRSGSAVRISTISRSRDLMQTLKSNENYILSSDKIKTNSKNKDEKNTSEENVSSSCQKYDIKQISSNIGKQTEYATADRSNLIKDWLGNVTKSEINYANRKNAAKKEIQNIEGIDMNACGDTLANNKKSPSHVMDYLESEPERKNHINWIENEIEHLKNLKKLLTTENELGINFELPFKASTAIIYPIHKHADLHFYDKIAASSGRSRNQNSASSVATNKAVELKKIDSEIEIRNEKEKYVRKVKRTTNEVLYEKVNTSANGDVEKGKHHLKITTYTVNEEKKFPKKDYRLDENKKCNRSKLETPYQEQPYEHQSTSDSNHHYSELRDADGDGACGLRKQQYNTESYATSEPSRGIYRDFSRSSISLPVRHSSTTTTTTTYQYDSQIGVGVQTTNSLLKTKPIFGPKLKCGCLNVCNCKSGGDHATCPTLREYQKKKSAQTQTKPCAVAYIINFEKPKSKCDEFTQSNDLNEHYTLQEYLHMKRPDFSKAVFERQKVLDELKCLRKERQKRIERILEEGSESSIQRKLDQLPPPPTKCLRIFKTKDMKAMTNRHYRKLPEVLAKAENESRERKRRNNRLLANVFNKRLQRRVHEGKLSLEHSRTVI